MAHSTACPGCGRATATWSTRCGACGTPLNGPQPAATRSGALGTTPQTARGPTTWGGGQAPPATIRWGGGLDVTRYLCAATYLDRAYAELLIRQIAAEPHLGVGAAPACDVPVVLRHAYVANARRHQRDLLLTLLLVLTLFSPAWFRGFASTPLLLFLSWMTVLVFELSTRYGRHLQNLRPNRFDPAAAPPPPNGDAAARLGEISAYAHGNVTAYSGYLPFVGYGAPLDSWSLTFDVTAPGPLGGTPRDFDVTELYEHVAQRLGTLSLPCLEIEERLFVEGTTVLGDTRFLADPLGRPVPRIARSQMDELKRAPEEGARPYLAVHSTGWGGDLVTSLFLRFVRSDSNLCVEAVQTVLFPLDDRYRMIDTLMPRPSLRGTAELMTATLFSTPFVMLAAPVRAVTGFSPDYWITWRIRRQNKRITSLRRFDYGARWGVRQQAAGDRHQRHFQKADSGLALKMIERRALDALIEFAEARGIDVSELVQRQQLIVNNGIIATGGAQVTSSSIASGSQSRISMRLLNKIPLVNTD
ncbi:zinc ribbon domain-containing protein [Streptomyces sp. NEAU-sy36]|uniref:zinc ribbon domain-containing protein n=1 Tax=unclassified Streptomyces TaxID=2593676 RepID=UPI0015D5BFF2|nr:MULTISPECIES: zinc ribbon domain-containing protein [unclassified Streptomyces]QLJ05258.1 zinc ribbon domain-containing protein [Streptomyces sp. NEAU-sy36]